MTTLLISHPAGLAHVVLILALLVPGAALAAEPSAPQEPDKIISAAALKEVETILQETPMKYSYPMLLAIQRGIRPIPPAAPPAEDKPAEGGKKTPAPPSK